MSAVYEVQRKAVALAISLNPTVVTVARTEYTGKDGGREKKTSAVGPFTICLFSRYIKRQTNDPAGLKDTLAWTALADSNATFKWGPNVADQFTVSQFGTFKVLSGAPVSADGQIAGYVLQLEAVK